MISCNIGTQITLYPTYKLLTKHSQPSTSPKPHPPPPPSSQIPTSHLHLVPSIPSIPSLLESNRRRAAESFQFGEKRSVSQHTTLMSKPIPYFTFHQGTCIGRKEPQFVLALRDVEALIALLCLCLCFSVASLRLPLSLCIISTLYSIYIVYTQHALSINQSIN